MEHGHDSSTTDRFVDPRGPLADDLYADDGVGDLERRRLVNELHIHQAELEQQNDELRRITDALDASNRRYAELYELAPNGYVTVDADGVITLANAEAMHLFDAESDVLIGATLAAFVEEAGRSSVRSWLARVIAGEHVDACVTQLERADATGPSVLMTATCSEDPLECRVALADITKQQRDEAERRALELLQQQQIFEHFADPTWLIAVRDGEPFRVSSVNCAFTLWAGLTRERIVGHPITDWIPASNVAFIEDKYAEVVATKTALRFEEIRTTPRGERITEATVVPIVSPEGNCHQLLCSFHDVTDERLARNDLEDERRRHMERLSTLEKFRELTVGRELKMVELKTHIAELTQQVAEQASLMQAIGRVHRGQQPAEAARTQGD